MTRARQRKILGGFGGQGEGMRPHVLVRIILKCKYLKGAGREVMGCVHLAINRDKLSTLVNKVRN